MKRVNRITEILKQEIQSGHFADGSYLPTEKQLQDRFAVSRSSIRRALDELVAVGWAIKDPNRGVKACQGPPGPRLSIIAFIDHADCVHKSLFFFLSQYLNEQGLHLVHLDSTSCGTMAALEKAADSGFAAAVFWNKDVFLDATRIKVVQSKMPVVAVDHCPNGVKVDVVRGDHFGGAQQAVSHLIALGRKQVALTGFLTLLEDFELRLLGYSTAHLTAELPLMAHNILFSSTVNEAFDEPRLLIQRLRELDRPDAIFVLHDLSVPAIATAVFDLGLRIPEDVAVVGFGNDLPFTLGNVGLTTVAMDWKGIAHALMMRLCYRLDHPKTSVEEIVLPSHLVIRGSCGAPEDKWQNDEYQVSSATITRRMPPNVWRSEFGSGAQPPMPNSLSLRGSTSPTEPFIGNANASSST